MEVRDKVRFGVFEVDLAAGELRRSGIRLKLQTQPFKVLAMLLERPGEVITREELQQRLWGDGTVVDFDHSLGTAINKIREALGDSADNPRFIETLSRRGYRMIAPVHVAEAPKPNLTAAAPLAVVPAKRSAKRLILIGTAAALAGLAAWVAWPSSQAPQLRRIRQITWSGRVFPGEISSFESSPGIATDGSRIYFDEVRDGRFLLAQASLADGETRPLQTPPEIDGPSLSDISPDGSRLLIRNHLAPETEQPLWIIPSAGGAARRVLSPLAHDATWMPDGQSILYASGHELSVTPNNGREPRRLAALSGRAFWLRWSPDGSRLRFTVLDSRSRTSSLWEMAADGSNLHPLLPGWNTPSAECCGSWTPDGKSFVFQSMRNGVSDVWALPEGGLFRREPVAVTAGPLSYTAPVVSRDGRRMFVIGTHGRGQLFRYDAASHQFLRCLPDLTTAGRTEYSPAGDRVAWISTADGSLWRSRLDGTGRLELTAPPIQVYMMRWSPDAQRLVFMGREPGQLWKLYMVSSGGGSPQPLVKDNRSQADPGWSPDGRSIVYGRPPEYMAEDSAPREIQMVDVQSRAVSTLPDSRGLFSPRWSPDGLHIVALSLDQRKLMLYHVAERKWAVLTERGADNPSWSSDGKEIYFHAFMEEGQPIYRLRIADRHLERIVGVQDVQLADAVNYTFSGLAPDNSPLVSVHLSTADIYSLDWNAR